MYSRKRKITIFIGIILGSFLFILLLTLQKYVVLGEVFLTYKGYIIPIIFGGIIGGIIGWLYVKLSPLNEKMKLKNQVLNERNVEIEDLYDELEVQSQSIDSLNRDLDSTLKKYFLLIESVMDINEYAELNQEDFIMKVYDIAKKVVQKYDFIMVYTYDKGVLDCQDSYGYAEKSYKNFAVFSKFIKVHFPITDIYYSNKSIISHLFSEKAHVRFDRNKQNSKEILFLDISNKGDRIGGIIFELDTKSHKTFTDKDLAIIKTLQNNFINYFEGVELNEIREKYLINIVEAMISMLEFHDSYTKGHSINVAKISRKIGKSMNLSEEELNELYLTGLLHDIAKTFIDAEILNKKGPLTEQEYEIVKKHPQNGADILLTIKSLNNVEDSVRYHHERCDGEGYPEGLKKEEIPRNARIICVADAYDAMITDRPYRKALSKSQVIEELRINMGTQFCENAGQALLGLIEKGILN